MSSLLIFPSHSLLKRTSVLFLSRILKTCLRYVPAFFSTCSRVSGGGVSGRPPGGAVLGRKIADQENRRVAHFLKMFQLAQHHRMPKVNVWGRWVHAEIHAQGFVFL